MKFKTHADIYFELWKRKKLRHIHWIKDQYIHLVDGLLCWQDGKEESLTFYRDANCYEIYEEPKPKRKIKLYRHIVEGKGGNVRQTAWSSNPYIIYLSEDVLNVEEKEIEV